MCCSFPLPAFLKTAGYIGFFGAAFAESGLLIGFLFPGDSLLFAASFLSSQGLFSLPLVIGLGVSGAFAGDITGYWFGKFVGPKLFRRKDSRLFHKEHLTQAQTFYESHGGKALVLARFMPIVRTFVPILAGVAKMHYPTFLLYNGIGAILWAASIPLLGFFLGSTIPGMESYVIPLVFVVILLSMLPGAIHLLLEKKKRRVHAS